MQICCPCRIWKRNEEEDSCEVYHKMMTPRLRDAKAIAQGDFNNESRTYRFLFNRAMDPLGASEQTSSRERLGTPSEANRTALELTGLWRIHGAGL